MDLLSITLFLLISYVVVTMVLKRDIVLTWAQSNWRFIKLIFKMKSNPCDPPTRPIASNRRQARQKMSGANKKDTRAHRVLTKVSKWHCKCSRCLRGNTTRCLSIRCTECSVPRVQQTANYLEQRPTTNNTVLHRYSSNKQQ